MSQVPRVVEIRVHGVHGTSPGVMLGVDDKSASKVAGDGVTGVFRTTEALPYRPAHDGLDVEAYSWAALTSGVQGALGWVTRVLWLFLLPFALVNLSYWARLNVGARDGLGRWGARAVRLAGLLLTVFFVVSTAVVAVDLLGWQCYRRGVPSCTLPAQLDVLTRLSAGGRLAVTALLPAAAIAVLWWLSRTTLSKYEAVTFTQGDTGVHTLLLRHRHLWSGVQRTRRLQGLHVAAGLATVVTFTGAHAAAVADGWPSRGSLLVTTAAGALVLIGSALSVLEIQPTDVEHDSGADPASQRQGNAPTLLRLALGVLLAHLLVLGSSRLTEGGHFHGHNMWFIVLLVLITAISLAVFVGGRATRPWVAPAVSGGYLAGAALSWLLFSTGSYHGWVLVTALVLTIAFVAALDIWHYRYVNDHDQHAWRGASSSVLLSTGIWVALLFTSCVVVGVADRLNGPDHGVDDFATMMPAQAVLVPSNDGPRRQRPAFVGTGKVTLDGASVVTDAAGSSVRVVAGTVRVEQVGLREDESTVGIGTTRLHDASALALPNDATVSYVDSCVAVGTSPSVPCTTEDDDFRSVGVLETSAAALRLRPAENEDVLLVNEHPPAPPIVVPQVLVWVPIGQLAWLLLAGAALAWCLVRYRRGGGRDIRKAALDVTIPPADVDACRAARSRAGLFHRSERILDVVGALTPPVALLVVAVATSGQAPWELAPWLRQIAHVAMWVTYAAAAGLLLLGSQIRRSAAARRNVGVLWDLTTFWPRAAHPLAPPCYAERVVPELLLRIRWALDTGALVVLSGHSQGSMILAAAASRLSDEELKRVRIVTYGSQIRALYGRIFPAVVGPQAIGYDPTTTGPARLGDAFPDVSSPGQPGEPLAGSLRARLGKGHWVNLFRRTDGLGWRVFSDHDSDLDVPVAEVPCLTAGDPGPTVRTHSGYQHSLAYRRVVAGWTGETPTPDPVVTGPLDPIPPM